ncbi:PREDICTED: NADH dehydrogenase [ubiquinone] 1 subunit C2 [Ceratosolen solmsi marchali]|uniref:NADH dehydrogenase [ubiquinone] 1 subunit C2 n=1 Tax=Ceratosolen solmsi marchali TaxID=326594 RepID=A0AAJ6YIB0_9HYME|nr:PREDICTED: NADH dehydrogenase [ubiquinone] 1 subunit C2 [Ceratosolen solmsi marchali]
METDESIKWAIDLLTPDETYKENLISKYYHYITLIPACLGGTVYMNWLQNRPYFASIHRYGVALIIGIAAANITKRYKTHSESKRDSILRQYIKLHPEDFQRPERKTFGEVFDEWIPCR